MGQRPYGTRQVALSWQVSRLAHSGRGDKVEAETGNRGKVPSHVTGETRGRGERRSKMNVRSTNEREWIE